MAVYITSSGAYLPGDPVDNQKIETVLGLVHNKPSRLKKKILKSNGILTRHYAIDSDHKTYISNAEMAKEAGLKCLDESYLPLEHIDLLSCATSQGDLVLPGFASMVQAQLELPNVEIHSSHGICSSSLMALKHGFLSLATGEHNSALVIASELASRLFKASRYERLNNPDQLDFNAEFLRWMLSDGAGALLLENQPRDICFKIDWIKGFSHADAYSVCMSVGSPSDEKDFRTWQDFPTYAEAESAGALLIRQDIRLLENAIKTGTEGFLKLVKDELVVPQSIDHVLCHYSSHYFKGKIFSMLEQAGVVIPEERWYTNLYTRGNTGCASIFIMLDEFRRTHTLQPGQTVFCMVPESGRFNNMYMKLTVEQA